MKTSRSLPISSAAAWFILAAAGATLGLIDVSAAQQQSCQTARRPLQSNCRVYLDTPAPPDTVPVAQPDFDYFAWNSFIALNWPALEVVPNKYRGVPDLSKSFAYAQNSDLAVWETFKEKREVFNHPNTAGQLTWYSPIDYGTLRQGGVSVTGRAFLQNAGASTPPNGLDETVEVPSQSLEPTYPNGTKNPILDAVPPAVTPRVWRGQPSARNPIVYEVKLNYDYFNYVVSKGYNVDNTNPNNPVEMAAMNYQIRLPVRTSAAQGSGQNPAVVGYRAENVKDGFFYINKIYRGTLTPPIPPVPPPPAQGSIQVKAAWLMLGGPNAEPSDFPTWHTTFAQYYVSDANGKPVPSEPSLFGLVGMHIIQRIHTTNPKNPTNENGTGGTFIFATWEHESIFNSPVAGLPNQPQPTYFYSNFFGGSKGIPLPPKGFYPRLNQAAYPVVRQYPVLENTKKVTAAFHEQIRLRNPNSVWLHYHLVGTQFQAVNLPRENRTFPLPPNDPTHIGQPAFLANLAIETNLGLQYFRGQPPKVAVIPHFQGNGVKSNPLNAFARNNANTSFGQSPYNMGGCMGCHGVAQTKGYAFSFVLLDGYLGAVTDTQDHFNQ